MAEPYRIIIAEDNRMAGKLLEIILTGLYPLGQISLAFNGQEALQAYEEAGADLVILDKDMPGIDGLELTRTLRTRDITIPIIMMAGDWNLEAEAKKAGATLFLRKPGVYSQLPRSLTRLKLLAS